MTDSELDELEAEAKNDYPFQSFETLGDYQKLVLGIISALRKERQMRGIAVEALNQARDIILNNPKGSYRGPNSGSIAAEAANFLQQRIHDIAEIQRLEADEVKLEETKND